MGVTGQGDKRSAVRTMDIVLNGVVEQSLIVKPIQVVFALWITIMILAML